MEDQSTVSKGEALQVAAMWLALAVMGFSLAQCTARTEEARERTKQMQLSQSNR